MQRYSIAWPAAGLVAFEPTVAEVRVYAPALAAAYNNPHNRAMLGNSSKMSAGDVETHYARLHTDGGRPLLFCQAGPPQTLLGDGDFRNVEARHAEFALLIAQTASHGQGLGTRFALMAHAFAFASLGLEQLFVTIVPNNAASRRLFTKLGYQVDARPEARRYIDDESDVSMSVDRGHFEALHAAQLAEIRVTQRTG